MAQLLNLPAITNALTAQATTPLQLPDGNPEDIILQANFVYGSGGTSVDAWVQTSIDGGVSWIDVANFHFTTASGKALYNLSALTPVSTLYVPTDGSLTANTSKDGIVGPQWRVKYTTVGVYAAATSLRVDAAPRSGRNRFQGFAA